MPGGTARSTNRLIDEILLRGDTELIGIHGSHRSDPRLALPTGLETRCLPVPGRVLTQAWNLLARPSIDRWVRADLVHAPGYLLPAGRSRAVVTIHDLAFIRHPEWFTAHGVAHMRRFVDRALERDAWVIAPSERTADDCVAAGFDPARLSLVPWGVDEIEFAPGEVDAAAERYGVDEHTVLYVGTVEPRKNLDGLARAMRSLPGRRLVVVGPSGWGDVAVDGAAVVGELDGRAVRALMARAGVLAYPSHFEGFGLPVLEAMSVGTAVVTTAGTASADVAGEAALAVDSGSPAALADAIDAVLTDDDLRARLAAAYRYEGTHRRDADIVGGGSLERRGAGHLRGHR